MGIRRSEHIPESAYLKNPKKPINVIEAINDIGKEQKRHIGIGLNYHILVLRKEVKQLKQEIKELKEQKEEDDDLFEFYKDLKAENKKLKAQLRAFGKIFDNYAANRKLSKEVNDEIDAERGQEVERTPKDFGIDYHEEELIEKNK